MPNCTEKFYSRGFLRRHLLIVLAKSKRDGTLCKTTTQSIKARNRWSSFERSLEIVSLIIPRAAPT